MGHPQTYLFCVTLAISCLVSGLTAAPAAVENDANADSRDKRSGEVIFFENSEKDDNSLKKRSEDWSRPSDSAEDEVDRDNLFIKSFDSKLEEEEEAEVLDELQKWAFDEALNYLVDQLVAEAYQEELDDFFVYDADDTPYVPPIAEIAEHKEMTTTKKPETQKDFDKEADALASLIAKENHKSVQPEKQEPIEVAARAPESYDMGMEMAMNKENMPSRVSYSNIEDELSMQSPDSSEENFEESFEESSEESFEESSEESSEESDKYDDRALDLDDMDSYSIEKILEYFDYLNKVKNMEDSFRKDAKNFEHMELGNENEEANDKPQIRKRRSIPDDWVDSRGMGAEGVCFTAEEARELKDLLLGLAKDRMILQEISSYMMADGRSGSLLEDGYPESEEISSKQLEGLAYRLNEQQRPVYQRQQPKRPFEFSPYDFGTKK